MPAVHRLTLIYRVPDVMRWRDVLTRHDTAHDGLIRRSAFCSLDDENEVMVELEFSTADSARSFLSNIDLRGVLDEVGLDIYPPVFVGVELEELRLEYP